MIGKLPPLVIPGRAEGANPESITTAAEYGFRAHALRACPGMMGWTAPDGIIVPDW